MCFAPQRRAIFPERNFQNGSEPAVFCTFWRTNVLRATAACHFSGSQLPKWLRDCGALYILSWKCASRHSGAPFFRIATSKMAPNLRCFVHFDVQMCFAPQRRAIFHISAQQLEATFRTSGTTNHWKNTAIRDFPNISRTWIFWDLTAVVLWFSMTLMLCYSPFLWLEYCLTWILFDSAFLLCFSTVHIVGS